MAETKTLVKQFNLGGLDLRSSDLLISPERSQAQKNFVRLDSDTGTSRSGFQFAVENADNNGGFGTIAYKTTSVTDGSVNTERLIVGQKLFRVSLGTIDITYSGSDSATASMLFDEDLSAWVLSLYEDNSAVLEYNCGDGVDEAVVVSVQDLQAAIDALANFAATITITGSGGFSSGFSSGFFGGGGAPGIIPAAFVETFERKSIDTTLSLDFAYEEEVHHPTSATEPFDGLFDQRNGTNFENATSAQVNNVVYIATGYDELKKYDGIDCYRAGMPTPSAAATLALVGGGSITDTSIKYIYTYLQKDAQGNEIEGVQATESATTSPAGQNVNVTLQNILASTGFNTDCAVVVGAQATVTTITVDNGSGGNHTMKVGQTAYFYDSISTSYVERQITAASTTTITIAGAAVTVADNAVISNNLRIKIYRTTAAGNTFSEVVEIPNNSFAATQVYLDSTTPANLGGDYLDPADAGAEHSLPPKGKYVSMVRGRLVMAGNLESPSTVFFSDIDSPEAFPSAYSFLARGNTNAPITGLSSGNEFFWVFKERNSILVIGELLPQQFRVDLMSENIGCVAHATITDINGILYWLGQDAFFRSVGGSVPEEISGDIYPVFKSRGLRSDEILQLKRAISLNDIDNSLYITYLPAEELTGTDRHANDNSRIVVYNYFRNEWYEWDAWNMAGGAIEIDGDLYFTERKFSSFDSNMHYRHARVLSLGSDYDMIDHNTSPVWTYDAAWNHFGEPSVPKKITRFKAYSNDPEMSANYTLHVVSERDFIRGVKDSEFDFAFGQGTGQGWGQFFWGVSPWGSAAQLLTKAIRLRAGKHARSVRYRFSHSQIYKRPLLTGYELEVALPYGPHIKES